MTVLNSTDRIMIAKLCGERDTALYSVAYSIALIVTLLTAALNSAFAPWLADRLRHGEYAAIRRVSGRYVLTFSLFTLGLMLIAPELLWLMGGPTYTVAKPVLLPVLLGCVCQCMYTLFVNVEQFCKKTGGMALASLSAAALNYVLNAWLIPRFGYVVAAYTTLIGYLWLFIAHMWLTRRIGMQQVYDNRRFVWLLLALCAAAPAVAWLYRYILLRYAVLAVYLVLVAVTVRRKGRVQRVKD